MAATWGMPDNLEEEWMGFERSRKRLRRSEQTIHLYRRAYVMFWQWATSRKLRAPDDIKTKHVNQWVDHLQETLGDNTVAIWYRNVRPFFSWWAEDAGEPNPFIGADRPPDVVKPVPVIDVDDVRRLVDACAEGDVTWINRRDTAMVRVLFDTGVRLGELASLDVDDWNRKHDTLSVTGKTGTRVVALSASTADALGRYMRVRARQAKADGPLWIGRKGRLTESGIAQALARRCKRAGLQRLNPHRFRHTWAHLWRLNDGQEGDLTEAAGWTPGSAMAGRYGKSAAAERMRRAQRRLAIGDQL